MANLHSACPWASRRLRSLYTVVRQSSRPVELQRMSSPSKLLCNFKSSSLSKLEIGSRAFNGVKICTPQTSVRRCETGVSVRCMSNLGRTSNSKSKGEPRGSLWRTRSVISKETVQAVHELRRAKDSPEDLKKAFQTRIPRLLKMDLLATLGELNRQNEMALALKIFDVVRKEMWYKPDKFLYRQLMDALGRNRMIPEIEQKFQELQDEDIVPDLYIYRELVGAYVRVHMLDRALEIHQKMVEIGCGDDPLTCQFIEKEKLWQDRNAAAKAEGCDSEQAEAVVTPEQAQAVLT